MLAEHTSPVRYAPDQKILVEGEETRDAYLIDAGTVAIQRMTPYGVYKLAELGPEQLFGETSFLDGHPRSGDALAKTEVIVFPLSFEALDRVFTTEQRLAIAFYWALWKSLSQKLRLTNKALAEFFSKKGATDAADRPSPSTAEPLKIGLTAKQQLFREQTLSPMEINFLATLSKERKYGPDEYIFREGETGDQLYVVLDGRVMISKVIVGAGEEALAFLGRGDYFGEMALIDQKPRSADAKAADGGAVVLSISREVLEGILDIQKVSSIRLLQLLCALIAKRLREIDDKLVGWFIFSAGSGQTLGTPDRPA